MVVQGSGWDCLGEVWEVSARLHDCQSPLSTIGSVSLVHQNSREKNAERRPSSDNIEPIARSDGSVTHKSLPKSTLGMILRLVVSATLGLENIDNVIRQ